MDSRQITRLTRRSVRVRDTRANASSVAWTRAPTRQRVHSHLTRSQVDHPSAVTKNCAPAIDLTQALINGADRPAAPAETGLRTYRDRMSDSRSRERERRAPSSWPGRRTSPSRSPRLVAGIVLRLRGDALRGRPLVRRHHHRGAALSSRCVAAPEPADARHPFGYGKESFVWAFLAALFTFVAGAGFSITHGVNTILARRAQRRLPDLVRRAGDLLRPSSRHLLRPRRYARCAARPAAGAPPPPVPAAHRRHHRQGGVPGGQRRPDRPAPRRRRPRPAPRSPATSCGTGSPRS